MLSKQELANLLEVLNEDNISDMTFDACFNKFGKHFGR